MEEKNVIQSELERIVEIAAKNSKLKQRLNSRSIYANNLKASLEDVRSAKAFKVMTTIWDIRNIIKFIYLCTWSLLFNKKFRKNLLSEENKYDRMEYLNKILNSRVFRMISTYWNFKDLIIEFTQKPQNVLQLVKSWKIIRSRETEYNREEYLTKILKSKLFKSVRYYWPIKNIFTVVSLKKDLPPNDFDEKMSDTFLSHNPLQAISKESGLADLDPRISKMLMKLEKEESDGNWKKVGKMWREIPVEYSDNEMLTARAKLAISVAGRLENLEEYKKETKKYNKEKSKLKNRKIAIFTANVGGYDSVKLPEKLDSRFDHILFTDQPTSDCGVFQIRPITYFAIDATRTARYIKTHPHLLLSEYEIAIWIDSSIMTLGDIYPLVEKFLKSGEGVGAIPHPSRRDVYEEAESCILRDKDNSEVIQDQIQYYQSRGFQHDDLIESGFMMFDLKNEKVKNFLNTWWQQMERFSKRDQLSLNYALSENGLTYHKLMEYPESVRNHPLFALAGHKSGGLSEILTEKLSKKTVNPYDQEPYSKASSKRIKDRKKEKVDIVICVHNAYEDVKKCLSSVIKKRGDNKNQKIIVVDDGSDDPTKNYLKKLSKETKRFKLIRNDKAVGYSKAANQGLRASSGNLVILLNSDTIVTKGWAEKLADAAFSSERVGVVGPVSNAAGHQSIPDIKGVKGQTAINKLPKGVTPEKMNKLCEEWTPADILPRVPLVHGFCIGITRSALEKVGYFDVKNFPHGYGEENDYCMRATDNGFSLVVATHTYVFHKKTKSYSSERRKQLVKKGSDKLKELYGVERLTRDIHSADGNQLLENVRSQADDLYKEAGNN